MASRSNDVQLLRDMASRLREIARAHMTSMAEKVLEVADEFDRHADELEQRDRDGMDDD
jgi:hypothetical protein